MFAAAMASVKARVDAVFATALWGAVAVLAGFAAVGFLTGALFVWIQNSYDTLAAFVALASIFALVALAALVTAIVIRQRSRRTMQAQLQGIAATAANAGVEAGETLRNVPGRYLVLGAFAAGLLASLSMVDRR